MSIWRVGLLRGVILVRGALWLGVGGLSFSVLVGCGGASPPPVESVPAPKHEPVSALSPDTKSLANASPVSHGAPPDVRSAHADSNTASARDTKASVGIRGITGSLTAFEVEQAMNARQSQLLACVQQRPRSLGHVAGDIAFHFDVDGQGKVERVLVTESDLGYPVLEDCLASVVATAPLQAPAGAQRAEAQWRMSVDPLSRPAELLDKAELESTIERNAADTYENCSIAKGRRFLVNGYLGRARKLSPVSVRTVPRKTASSDEDASEQPLCLAQALEQWKGWPKSRGYSKVSFELRWVAAPPPPRKGKKLRRRR
jgi:hypothetical protein